MPLEREYVEEADNPLSDLGSAQGRRRQGVGGIDNDRHRAS